MDVNEWISYECSDEGTCTPNIHNSSTRSHPSEGENRTRNRSKSCKCKRAFTLHVWSSLVMWAFKRRSFV